MEIERRTDLEVKHFRIIHQESETNQRVSVFIIPATFKTQAIKELLTNIVWGQGARMVVCLADGSTEKPDIITDTELKSLRDYPSHDRRAQLDMDALRIKSSQTAFVIEYRKK